MAGIIDLIQEHQLLPHLYADDTQVCGFCRPDQTSGLCQQITACVEDSGAGSNLKVEGHNFRRSGAQRRKIFFTVPLHFFVVPQGTIEKCRAQ